MNTVKKIPQPLIQRILVTLCVGMGCLILGTATSFATNDRTMLILSVVLFCASIARMIQYYHIARQQKYVVVCGVCMGMRPKWRVSEIKIVDDAGIETTLRVSKQSRIRIGEKYRFYFKQQLSEMSADRWVTALASDHFLGFELERDEGAGGTEINFEKEGEER